METDRSAMAVAQAALLFANDAAELERTLTLRSMKARDVIIIPLTVDQAVESQEGLAKAAYSRTFDWVVSRLNSAVESQTTTEIFSTIGVLDIFGFEIFECNSFEQLCINLANEKLQGHFNDHIFKLEMAVRNNQPFFAVFGRLPAFSLGSLVPRLLSCKTALAVVTQQTYAAEGLDCRRISFQDNQPIIDLIERRPLGLLPLV